MKRLILVGGTMGVGKTTVCRELQKLLPNNVFLDGDWCWDMRPFVVNDETKAVVMDNICAVLNRFIACSVYENIIFCWVMHQQEIIDEILSRLNLDDVKAYRFSLISDVPGLRARISGDVLRGLRTEDAIERSLEYRASYLQLDTIKIDTSKLTAQQAAKQIIKLSRK